jgi:hypothetical protein
MRNIISSLAIIQLTRNEKQIAPTSNSGGQNVPTKNAKKYRNRNVAVRKMP